MKKLVIIGGGFAGTKIARSLEKKFKTALIDNKDYFEYTPGILRGFVDKSYIKSLQKLHRDYLKKSRFIKADVKKVDNSFVYLKNKKIKYDYLVIATGSTYKKPIKQSNILLANRSILLKNNHKNLQKAKEILIIGGGVVGVELASEIADYYHNDLKEKKKTVNLIQLENRLIPRENPCVSIYAAKHLKKHHINTIFNERVKIITSDFCKTDKGTKLYPDLIFTCTGIYPNSGLIKETFKECLDDKDFIKVDNNLHLINNKNIFVAGDVADVKEEKLAQNAENHADIIIQNIIRTDENKPLLDYTPKERIKVISLGRYDGILVFKDFILTGLIPGLLKNFIKYKVMKNFK